MAHDEVGVEPERGVEDHLSVFASAHLSYTSHLSCVKKGEGAYLAFTSRQNRRQPPTLPTIHQQEHRIVFVNQLLEPLDVGFALGD